MTAVRLFFEESAFDWLRLRLREEGGAREGDPERVTVAILEEEDKEERAAIALVLGVRRDDGGRLAAGEARPFVEVGLSKEIELLTSGEDSKSNGSEILVCALEMAGSR